MDYAIAAFCLVLIGIVWAMTLDRVNFERTETIAQAAKQNANLAIALEEQTIRTLKSVDQVALFVRDQYLDDGPELNIRQMIESGVIDASIFIFISVIDEHGNLLFGSADFKPTNVADREYFKLHQQRDPNQPLIGKPDFGRVTGKWTIHMTRRINKPDGAFGGVVLIAVDPNYFTSFYQKADLGEQGLVSLIGLDGITRASRAGGVNNHEQDARNRIVLAEQTKSGAGSFSSSGEAGGVPRFISYRTLQQYPMIVMVGTSQAETLASFRQRERNYYLVAASVSLFGLLFIAVLIVAMSHHRRVQATLQESEARYRSVIAAIAEGVVLRDKDARIVTCNASAERILGKTLDQMRGSMFYDSSWQAVREDGTPFPIEERPIRVVLRTGQLQSNVVQGLRKLDGTVLWLSMNVQPLFDESDTTLTAVVSTLTDITGRKQTELRQAMEHTVTRILGEAETLAEAVPRIIQTICETMQWHCGARWQMDKEAGLLRCIECWGVDTPEIREFMAENSKRTVNPEALSGRGLVRRIHNTSQPVWITDISQERSLNRAPLVIKAGLHGAFGFPLLLGGEVLGVMEFFHRDVRKPDALLLKIAGSIGNQIGQFMTRKQAEERIRHLANYDELTGLPNRSMFQERLHHALAQAQRHARPLAVLFFDLDYFKNINDTLGHEAGDRVLAEVAERLRGCLRDSDTVGRLGGDEFVVLIEELPQPVDVAAVAQKILDAVARPFILAAQKLHIGASIGISAFPEDGKDLETLLKHADAAMYRAKERGRNNYQFYSAQG